LYAVVGVLFVNTQREIELVDEREAAQQADEVLRQAAT
jgi:hypothetical protein